jgi:hypothetical protein
MNKDIQNKLAQFEAQPPAEAWNRIAAALDDSLNNTAIRLQELEVSPPLQTWDHINHQLDEKSKAPIIPFYKKYATALLTGSAAAVLALILFFSGILSNKGTVSEPSFMQVVRNLQPTVETEPTTVNKEQQNLNEATPAEASIARRSYKQESVTENKRDIETLAFASHDYVAPVEKLIPDCVERNSALAFTHPVDRYMVYSREDGNAVKLPKKLFDAVACPSKDAECKLKLKQVQEKFAASAFTADFTGVLDIINNLGENQ